MSDEKSPDNLFIRIWLGSEIVMIDGEANIEHTRFYKLKQEVRRCFSEFVGTFLLVFLIAGVQCVSETTPQNQREMTLLTKAIASGVTLCSLIYTFGPISGAHLNPVITIAFLLRGIFTTWWRIILYILFQLLGSILGGLVLKSLFDNSSPNLGTTIPSISQTKALGLEIILTFILVNVILSVAERSKILGTVSAIAVGSTFTVIEIIGWNLSGASVNPFRTLGPMIVANNGWKYLWIYLVGPFIGMLFAVIFQRLVGVDRIIDDSRMGAKGNRESKRRDNLNVSNT